MKKLILVLVLLVVFMLAGCTSWLPGVEPEVEPESVAEVVVNAILEEGEVLWSIENISEDHIYDYSLTFTVLYAEVGVKTYWTEVVSGVNLFPTDVDYGTLTLPIVEEMEPETLITVLATY